MLNPSNAIIFFSSKIIMKYDESYLPFVGKHKEFFFLLSLIFPAEINLLVIILDECTISLKARIARVLLLGDGMKAYTAQL